MMAQTPQNCLKDKFDKFRSALKPPIAQPRKNDRDHYAWLRDPAYPAVDHPEILRYLEAENGYCSEFKNIFSDTHTQLLTELRGRLTENETSVPVRRGDYLYWRTYKTNEQYPIVLRAHHQTPSTMQTIVDCNQIAKGYFKLGNYIPSLNGQLVAITMDRTGDERYELWIYNMNLGSSRCALRDISPEFCWLNDDLIAYTKLDHEWRPNTVLLHQCTHDQSQDVAILRENDPCYSLAIEADDDGRYVFVAATSKTSTEYLFIDRTAPHITPKMIVPRRTEHEYYVTLANDNFYILTNDQHENFRLVKAAPDACEEKFWQEIIAPKDNVYLKEIVGFNSHIAVITKKDFKDHLAIMSLHDHCLHTVPFEESCYDLYIDENCTQKSSFVRLGYSSLTRPKSIIDCDLSTRSLHNRKTQDIPSGYNPSEYSQKTIFALARDGAHIPISLFYKNDLYHEKMPVYLYGYGSYGYGIPDAFSPHRLSLVNRGFIYAIAHIRGGDEGGHSWHRMGRLENKWNTFHDFIDAATCLVETGYAAANKIVCSGGSAGGMLVGAVINARPDLFCAAIAHVPFVDVLNTMMDSTLPLTPPEYLEWGDPAASKEVYERIASYSPYDNVTHQKYPHLFVTAGLHDPRVTYWEPAKWVAKIRAHATNDPLIILKTNMEAGHGGESGRFAALDEIALEYAFVLTAVADEDRA